MSKSAQADGITMSSDGVYSLATKGAKDVIDNAMPLVVRAIDSIPRQSFASHFTLADMGCADGGTSLEMIQNALVAIRQRASETPVTVTYTDQPRNDFNALVKNIHGLGAFQSYFAEFKDVYPVFSGTSFYGQMLPPASLHLGFSATAMHWLSDKPGDISNHVHMVGAEESELENFRSHAHGDWRQILLNRARELVSGGKLVLVNFCIDETGQYLGNTGGVNMFDTFNEIWLEFVRQGRVTEAEYVGMTLPQYYNTVEEFSAPLVNPEDAVYQAGLRLEHIETQVVPCPFAVDFKQHGDAEKFAEEYIPTIRTWNQSIYYNALSEQRSVEERQSLIEDYYSTYKSQVRENPEGHGMDYVHAYMTITKV